MSAFNHVFITPSFHSLFFSLPLSTSYRLSDLEIYQKPLLKQASHSSYTAGTFKAPVSHLMAQRVIRMDRRMGYCR